MHVRYAQNNSSLWPKKTNTKIESGHFVRVSAYRGKKAPYLHNNSQMGHFNVWPLQRPLHTILWVYVYLCIGITTSQPNKIPAYGNLGHAHSNLAHNPGPPYVANLYGT
jgi:hypothetical protein